MYKFIYLFVLVFFLTAKCFGQGNSTCANAAPFCTAGQYPAGTNQPNNTQVGCLFSQPNPAWFSIPIAQSGTLSITMSAASDIDFISWGPFSSPTGNCGNLNANTQVPNTNGNNGCSYSGSSTENLIITNAQAGQYYILLITNFSNQQMPINITQNAVPGSAVTSGTIAITATNNSPVCEGQSINFSAAGASTYTWTGPGGFVNPSANPQSIPVSQLSNTGTYTVYGEFSVAGAPKTCTGVTTSYVQVKPNPTLTVTKGGDFCAGKSFNLNASGAYTYTWTGPNTFSTQGSSVVFTNNAVSMTGTYYVTGSTQDCPAAGSISVKIHPLPPVLASTNSVCLGESFNITASGAETYTWTGPVWANSSHLFSSIDDTIAVNISKLYHGGYYYLAGKDTNGCVNYDTVLQIVRPIPFPLVDEGRACFGSPLMLGAAGGAGYKWSGPHGFTSNLQAPVINNANSYNSGVYYVTVTSIYGCSETTTVSGVVYPQPPVQVGGEIEVCEGGKFVFSGKNCNEYRWLASYGEVLKGPVFSISSTAPELQTTYTLVGIDDHACTNAIHFHPIVKRLPQAKLLTEETGACVPFCPTLTLQSQVANLKTWTWRFSDGETAKPNETEYKKCMTKAGVYTYTIHLSDSVGCANTLVGKLNAYPLPVADFEYLPERPNENDNTVTFYDKSRKAEISNLTWDFYTDAGGYKKDTSNIRYQQTPVRTYKDVGTYLVYLTATSNNGCKDSVAKLITIEEDPAFFVPDVFTPNGDGLNDVFMPKAIAIKEYKMQIFNRWGALIFTSTDIAKGWDGKISNEETHPMGDYVYVFTVLDVNMKLREYKGHFTLMK
ncbi:MAG: gliding motility-associated C-terminal domain-containing protein [Bacteroidetes bacterium]|nr:gliding motility-associated C-terminal domain-containing protein [Bacteroidota bacterium]